MSRLPDKVAAVTLLALAVLLPPTPATAQDLLRIQGKPVASIGDGSGKGQDLSLVGDATLAPDGRILLLDGGSHSIRVYSPTGAFLSSVGRDGDGPGEYRGFRSFRLLPSGELLIYDGVAQRLTRLDADLDVMDTRRVAFDVGAGIPVRGDLRPLNSSTVLIARGNVSIMESVRRGDGRYEDDLVVVAHRDEASTAILKRPRGPTFKVSTGRQGLFPPVPFEEALLFAAGAFWLVSGTTHGTTFEIVGEDGEPLGTFELTGSPRPVTARDWDLFKDRFREARSGGFSIRGMQMQSGTNVEKFLDATPRGRLFPLFDALLVDGLDRLWVREYSLEGDTVTWQIAELNRGVTGRLDIPRAWTLLEAGQDYVLVRERDEFDVEMVRKYVIGR